MLGIGTQEKNTRFFCFGAFVHSISIVVFLFSFWLLFCCKLLLLGCSLHSAFNDINFFIVIIIIFCLSSSRHPMKEKKTTRTYIILCIYCYSIQSGICRVGDGFFIKVGNRHYVCVFVFGMLIKICYVNDNFWSNKDPKCD